MERKRTRSGGKEDEKNWWIGVGREVPERRKISAG
jgi:hypothetical protein